MINDNLKENKKKKSDKLYILFILVLVSAIVVCGYLVMKKNKQVLSSEMKINSNDKYLPYRISGNSLEAFDLYFLQLENTMTNKVYSPLSIKHALGMLLEGTNGNTRKQIEDIIGFYNSKKYTNSSNLSLANGVFIRDSFKPFVKDSYVNTLTNKYNAEVIYDSFSNTDNINSWISDKTLKLINKLFDRINKNDMIILTNALAIDMEWASKINKNVTLHFPHEKYSGYFDTNHALDFNGNQVTSTKIGAVINNYDIVNTLGEGKIRETLKKEYEKWLSTEQGTMCKNRNDYNENIDTISQKIVRDLRQNYQTVKHTTDFNYYIDDEVKVFAKDLKEYDGTTLQYIGIMPKKDSLENYIKNIQPEKINSLINNLKSLKANNFKNGVITEVSGYIPMFKYEDKLKLLEDLNRLGITDVFDAEKADLTNMSILSNDSQNKLYVSDSIHKANIDFSIEGIKAAAVTSFVVSASAAPSFCNFDYLFDVPVEKVDLTFDKPFMYLIRDKETGEVWFVGSLYSPTEIKNVKNMN